MMRSIVYSHIMKKSAPLKKINSTQPDTEIRTKKHLKKRYHKDKKVKTMHVYESLPIHGRRDDVTVSVYSKSSDL